MSSNPPSTPSLLLASETHDPVPCRHLTKTRSITVKSRPDVVPTVSYGPSSPDPLGQPHVVGSVRSGLSHSLTPTRALFYSRHSRRDSVPSPTGHLRTVPQDV